MLTANYDYIPGVQKANFNLPFRIKLEPLKSFFEKRNMDAEIKGHTLIAKTKETYIYVSRNGKVQIHSFRRIRSAYICKKIATFKAEAA